MVEKDNLFLNGGEAEEVLVFYTMSRLGFGPKLYGVFEGGRLEEFVEGRTLINEDVQNPDLMAAFAKNLFKFHALKLPMNRNYPSFIEKIDLMLPDYVSTWKDDVFSKETEAKFQGQKDRAAAFDIQSEFAWLKSVFPKIKTRRVFSHNDMNRANCLLREGVENAEEKVILIDYEMACYNYRGMDIGLHFHNRTFDVSNPMNRFRSGLDYPTEEERRHFVKAYLDEARKQAAYEIDEEGLDSEDVLLLEAEFFNLVFQVFFLLLFYKDFRKYDSMGFDKIFNIFEMFADSLDRYESRKAALLERFGHFL